MEQQLVSTAIYRTHRGSVSVCSCSSASGVRDLVKLMEL